jgi:endonuclease/exonuclease/phosphatase family metal-dependent hydrolase
VSWNVAFGSPFRQRGRAAEVTEWLDKSGADVLLLQEARQDLLHGLDWVQVAAPATGPAGSCALVACRPRLAPVPVTLEVPSNSPEKNSFCLVAAALDRQTFVSMYVPWRSGGIGWMKGLLRQFPASSGAVLIGTDMNAPVGPRSRSHPAIEYALEQGWNHVTPLHTYGPTMRKSHIDHVFARGVAVRSWGVDRSVLDERLSDHAATIVELA